MIRNPLDAFPPTGVLLDTYCAPSQASAVFPRVLTPASIPSVEDWHRGSLLIMKPR